MYSVRGEVLSGKVYDIVTYIIVTCDDENSVTTSDRATQRKFLRATVTFIFKGGGGGGQRYNEHIKNCEILFRRVLYPVPVTTVCPSSNPCDWRGGKGVYRRGFGR